MTATTWAVLVGFLGVLTAYVVLAVTGHDTSGLVNAVITIAGLLGLGAHVEKRTREQNATIDKIDKQTNGVLDQRIKEGAAAALTSVLVEHGLTKRT